MYIFRPVTVADLPAVEALAAQSPVGGRSSTHGGRIRP